jgi:uncharacterized membrane protein YfcA
MEPNAKFALAGLIVGTLVGFSGMGGGSLMTPLLIALGLPAPKAVGTDLIYSAVTKSLGTVSHARRQHVDWKVALWLAAGSVPASIAGVLTISVLKNQMGADVNRLLQQLLGGMLVIVGVLIVVKIWAGWSGGSRGRSDNPVEMTTRRKMLAVGTGLVGGYGVGLTSIGSGTLFALMLMTAFPLVARRVVGTDLFHAMLLVWAAGLAHAVAGNVQFNTVGAILVGSIPGVLIGSRFTGRIPERPVRGALGAVLVLSGSLLL